MKEQKKIAFIEANVLSKTQLKEITGGRVPPPGSEDDCAGQAFWVETPAYCGYGIGTMLTDGTCVILEPGVKIAQPCGIA